MKILLLTSCQDPKDGWSVVGHNIVKNLENCKISIFSSENKKLFRFGRRGLKSELYDKFGFLTIIYDVLNVLFLTKEKPELIHCNVEYYAPVALILSKIYHIPYTITAHGTYGVLLPFKYRLYKKAFKLANTIITVSNYTKKRMIEEGLNSKYMVILNGVDKKTFFPNVTIKKKNFILFVGNLKPRKV